MPASAPSIKIAENITNTLNSNSQSSIIPTNPVYHQTMGSKNMYNLLARHGPDALYSHIMKAAFDPVYGREFSLAQPEEVKTSTVFPLAEEQRPHERSENSQLISLLGGYHKKTDVSNPIKDTAIIYDSKKRENQYQPYSGKYNKNYRKNDLDSSEKKSSKEKNTIYRITSMIEALEKKGNEYFKKFYNAQSKGDNSHQEGLYKGKSAAGKAFYSGQKIKSYMQKTDGKIGYDSKPENQESGNYLNNTQNNTVSSDYTADDKYKPESIDSLINMPSLEEFNKSVNIRMPYIGNKPQNSFKTEQKYDSISLEERVELLAS